MSRRQAGHYQNPIPVGGVGVAGRLHPNGGEDNLQWCACTGVGGEHSILSFLFVSNMHGGWAGETFDILWACLCLWLACGKRQKKKAVDIDVLSIDV